LKAGGSVGGTMSGNATLTVPDGTSVSKLTAQDNARVCVKP